MTARVDNRVRIAVVGTGAMGSIYAALLADAGHDVWAVDAWPEHVCAMRDQGLRVEGASGDRTVRLNATGDVAEVGEADLVIIATKHDGVASAAEAVRGIVTDETPVLAIQNGLGSGEMVAQILGGDRLLLGVVGGFGASMKGPGHAHHNGMEFVRLGAHQPGAGAGLDWVADVWRSGGFQVLTFDDIHKMIWEKLICNCTYSGTCTVTGLTVGGVMETPDAWSVASACAVEAWETARGHDIAVEIDDPVDYVRTFGSKIPHARPSMAQDHAAGRRGEIDVINGAIPREAQKLGRETPVNAAVSAIIRARETLFT